MIPTVDELRNLTKPSRVAWGCSVLDRLATFFSPYAREKYCLSDTLAHAWAYAGDGRPRRRERVALFDRLETVDEQFVPGVSESEVDDEGYGFGFATLAITLLNEIQDGNGEIIWGTAYTASWSYANHILYRYGVGNGEVFIRGTVLSTLGAALMDFSGRAYTLCLNTRPSREQFRQLPFDSTTPLLSTELLSSVKYLPPAHEIEYIRTLGLTAVWPSRDGNHNQA